VIALVQRVAEARVAIGDRVVGAIGRGALLFVCAEPGDSEPIADRLVAKVLGLRIFADAAGKMNLDLAAVGGGLLVVSQFTLAADTSRGHRPGFSGAAGAELGRRSTSVRWRRRTGCTATSPAASLAPTCRSASSTTGRSRFRSRCAPERAAAPLSRRTGPRL